MKQFSNNLTAQSFKSQFGKKHTKTKRHEEDFKETNQIMTKNLFNGKTSITLDEYLEIRSEIQQQLWHYEFC